LTATIGIPAITPLEAPRVRPAGSVPLVRDHEYGVVPPVAVRVALYAVPTCPRMGGLTAEFSKLPAKRE
jgi:hypothetical protein